MASYTTNLNLKKPSGSENVAIGDINNNMDTIDNAYGTLNSNMNTRNKEVVLTSSQNILTVALDLDICPLREARYFDLRNSNNSGVPTVYGVAVVMKRNVNNPLVVIYGENGNIYYNTYSTDQSVWAGWKQVNMTSI